MTIQPHPDSVRLAMPAEAIEIAEVQQAWLAAQSQLAPIARTLDHNQIVQAWLDAILRPPLATYRVLVAVNTENHVVGFAVAGPSDDPDAGPTDGVIAEFCVHPESVEQGHEDRLMNAVTDTLLADGFERATWWISAHNDALRSYLHTAGWAADGAHREIGDEQGLLRIKQVRMHTALA